MDGAPFSEVVSYRAKVAMTVLVDVDSSPVAIGHDQLRRLIARDGGEGIME